MRTRIGIAFSLLFVAICCGRGLAQTPPAPLTSAAPYAPQAPVSGTLKLAGSRTMNQLAAVWTDSFRQLHPDSKAELDFHGSETAFKDLGGDKPAIGLLSRELTKADQEAFASAHPGQKLVDVKAAFGAIAVVVHPDNPIKSLSLAQLKLLFGQADGKQDVTWGQVGLEGDWATIPVVRVAPDEASGSRVQFNSLVLGPQTKPATVTAHSWHTKIVEDVAAQRGAVGFVNFANSRTDKVRTTPIVATEGGVPVPLTVQTIAAGQYPLLRPLSVIVVLGKDGIKDPLVTEFVHYVLSRNGQEDVIKDGFQPLGRAALLEQFDHLGWNTAK